MLEFRVLGPIRVVDGERDVPLGGAKQRALLATLVLRANHVVPRDQLVDNLWGEHPPDSAHALQMQISRLRRTLRAADRSATGADYVVTRDPGYLLQVPADRVDVVRFEHLLARGRDALAAGQGREASDVLGEALALWRGAALADVAFEGAAPYEAVRLEELRLTAIELRVDAELGLGRHQAMVPELRALVAQHPLRERLWRQLVVALYRSSRQAEALEALRDLRDHLGQELGIDPSPSLQDLERSVLQHDPALRASVSSAGPGAEIGGYRIERLLGRGSGGAVFLAEDVSLGRKAALKVLASQRSQDPGFRERFLRECRSVASLDHPNVIPVYGAGEDDGVLYLAMRYVAGSTLAALVERLGRLPVERALAVVGQVAAALDAAHAAGLVHGDVKPGNVLVAEAGTTDHVYLSDFGMARSPDDPGPPTAAGSFDYAAPEQLRDGAISPRSDEYSLACVAYELLAGESPFHDMPESELVRGADRGRPPGIAERRPQLGAGADGVFATAMAHDGADRFPSCGAFAAELRRALTGPGTRTEAASRPALPAELDPGGPLFGRERDLAWLARMWRASTAGSGGVVLVAGPRGIGKTRLAAEFARTAHLGGASVAYASCVGPPEAAIRALRTAGDGPAPRLLVIDDADATDVATARLFAQLGAAGEGGSMILATCRDAASPATVALLGSEVSDDRIHRLAPLDARAVAGICGLYAPGVGAGAVDAIVAETGGIPLLVHQAVTERVRAGSVRRLDEEAAAARGRREELRASEDAVAGRVRDLRLAAERVDSVARDAEQAGGPAPGVCPFRGLAPFDIGDAEFFFGRERLVGTLVARLVGTAVLAVVGPSGSGKSSVVRAGLVPALSAGALPGSDAWTTVVIRPGEHPGTELAAGVASAGLPGAGGHGLERVLGAAAEGLSPPAKLVLVVDQFEEVFTTCRDEEERIAFIDALVDEATRPNGRCVVVIAIRADYYGRCAAYPRLADLVAANQVLIGPMDRRELRHAIELPAERAGLRVEEDLTAALVEDVAEQPGGLPLLSTALLELWERRDGRWLRASEYARSGRVEAAVARLAERTYEHLTPDRRATARAILLRLTGPGEGDEVVRRRVPLAEFVGEGADERRAVLDVLAASRLVTMSEGTVEVAHEALLREWPRLRGWLDQDIQGRAIHRHLIRAARDWDERGRDTADLYRGARLASASEWADANAAQLNDLEAEFVARSVSANDVAIASGRRTVRRLRALLAGMVVFLVLALVAGGIALVQRERARRASVISDSRFLASQSITDDRLTRALLLSVGAVRLDDSAETRSALLAATFRSPQAVDILHLDRGVVQLALSPDGRTLAVAESDGRVHLIDTATHRWIRSLRPRGQVDSLSFSPDGDSLAVGRSPSPQAGGAIAAVEVLDVLHGNRRYVVTLFDTHGPALLAYSPDGATLAVVLGDQLMFADANTGTVASAPAQLGAVAGGLAFLHSGGQVVVTSPGGPGVGARTLVLDIGTGGVHDSYQWGGRGVAVSPDDTQVVLTNGVGQARILDLGARVPTRLPEAGAEVWAAAFTPDGKSILVAGTEGARLIDAHTGGLQDDLTGQTADVLAVATGRHGALYTGSEDKTVIVWNSEGRGTLERPFTVGSGATGIAFGPGVIAVDGERSIRLFDAATTAQIGRLTSDLGPVDRPVLAPDGSSVVASVGGSLERWRVGAAGAPTPVPGPSGVQPVSLSPDDRFLAVLHGTKPVALDILDVVSGAVVRRLPLPETATLVAVSPDWTWAAVGFGASRSVWVWGMTQGTVPAFSGSASKIFGVPGATAMAFSPDGRLIAVGRFDGRIVLADPATGQLEGRSIPGTNHVVDTLGFDATGTTLASSDSVGTNLWDVPTHAQMGTPLTGDLAAFDPAVERLAVVDSDTGRGSVWDLDEHHLVNRACRVAGRDLALDEWAELVPDLPYRGVCSSLP